MAGETSYKTLISAITQANPCVITTSAAHGYQSNQLVRVTDLGGSAPVNRGMENLTDKRFRITVLSTTTFSLQDPITGDDVDSSLYTAYVSGGNVNMITRSLRLNVPQQFPYDNDDNQYVANPYKYEAAS